MHAGNTSLLFCIQLNIYPLATSYINYSARHWGVRGAGGRELKNLWPKPQASPSKKKNPFHKTNLFHFSGKVNFLLFFLSFILMKTQREI